MMAPGAVRRKRSPEHVGETALNLYFTAGCESLLRKNARGSVGGGESARTFLAA